MCDCTEDVNKRNHCATNLEIFFETLERHHIIKNKKKQEETAC